MRRKFTIREDEFQHICALDSVTAHAFRKQTHLTDLKTCTEISVHHPRTKYYFRSLAAIEKERIRHREMPHGKMVIHPLSMFRLCWDILQILFIFTGLMVIPLNFIHGPMNPDRSFNYGLFDTTEYIEIICDALFIVNFIVTFFTGHCNYKKKEVILNVRLIARAFVATFGFYIDLLCCISFISIFKVLFIFRPYAVHFSYLRFVKALGVIKIFRTVRLVDYVKRVGELFRQYSFFRIAFRYALLFILFLHWLTCIYVMFLQNSLIYKDGNDFVIGSRRYELLIMADYITLYLNSMYNVISYLLLISIISEHRIFYAPRLYHIDAMSIFVIYSTIGFIVCNLLMILIMQMVLAMDATEVKYHSIMAQLSKYMFYHDLPKSMRDRIICYYDYRFQKKYFRETAIMNMLSNSLRKEINLHLCRSLIETVALLRDLPPDVISEVVSNLKHQVFLYNDVIVKAGSRGECMYFIANGTVSVSTPTGREICHLQDGAYFGEIALLAMDNKRIANVVAIEICEVYRLDRIHFRRCFDENSAFYKKLEQIAEERMEKTFLLEELHKKYLLDRTTKRRLLPKQMMR